MCKLCRNPEKEKPIIKSRTKSGELFSSIVFNYIGENPCRMMIKCFIRNHDEINEEIIDRYVLKTLFTNRYKIKHKTEYRKYINIRYSNQNSKEIVKFGVSVKTNIITGKILYFYTFQKTKNYPYYYSGIFSSFDEAFHHRINYIKSTNRVPALTQLKNQLKKEMENGNY